MSIVTAPLPGTVLALADVPDPVFAQGMVGAGAAIDPPAQVVEVVAPIAGRIVKLHPHAFAILGEDGVGVLVHLGIDTVGLNGEGFTLHAAEGDALAAGAPVVTYDVPSVIAAGLSAVVPVVILDAPADSVAQDSAAPAGTLVAATTPLLTVTR
ncbi:PTS sugar transporter subunit IIA [Serinibacter salmoneus]|uniref:PTS system N-acetylglucosamine-specific IIA component (Glc family) n=1 Tax=Serinibacter salmoneus TaxID=556530 RepID=A0A2A9D0W7_9MICO|nr:PTS glucose transporter subunit IIA [Serinibacter salmoneus]PFG19905.1 PTS system N-acetylglucosamine-specific IIA component (Glc family) [Serinibacter salmoneus]